MPADLHHIAGRVLNAPLLCTPEYLDVVVSALAPRLGLEPTMGPTELAAYKRPVRAPSFDKATGILVMPIVGGLVHRSEGINPPSGMTGYTSIQNVLTEYLDTQPLRGVLLDVDSPGGEVAGLHEAAAFISSLKGEVHVYALANALMASAAYWLSAGAERIFAVPNAAVGSIGVITAHMDRSKEFEKRGQKVTLIHAGTHKAAGNPYEPLPDDVRASVQKGVDDVYGVFVEAVAVGRGIDVSTVRSTEAGVFRPVDAKKIGLIDAEATYGEVLRALQQEVEAFRYHQGYNAGTTMSKENLIYGESDLSRARSDAHAEGVKVGAAAATVEGAKIKGEFAGAIATLFPESKKAAVFTKAVNGGMSIAAAAELAGEIEEPKAAAPQSATSAAVDAMLSAHTPKVGA